VNVILAQLGNREDRHMKIRHGRKEDGRLGAGTTSSNLRAAPRVTGAALFLPLQLWRIFLFCAPNRQPPCPGIDARALRL